MMPRVKIELLNSIGKQMENKGYMEHVSKEFCRENPSLAHVLIRTQEVMGMCVSDKTECDGANVIMLTNILAMYQAIKQQMVCEELKDESL